MIFLKKIKKSRQKFFILPPAQLANKIVRRYGGGVILLALVVAGSFLYTASVMALAADSAGAQPQSIQAEAEPADLLTVQFIPNDPDLPEQYYLSQVNIEPAWDVATTSPEVVVAVIDTGVDIYHPDLSQNIWKNEGEIKDDGRDNDHNGYVDDYQGWDFIMQSPNPRPKFGGETSALGINHGTVVAGLIGAVGHNNFGIAGVDWQVKIMPLRALNNLGTGDVPTVIAAINYAIDNGADIINLSIVGNFTDADLAAVIAKAYHRGLMIMAAAGNESSPLEVGDLTLAPKYPICYDGDDNYVFGVGSVDYHDVLSEFSNYGNCIDVMAPGEYFYSTSVYEPVFKEYQKLFGGYWSGTSVAAPLVSATAAIIKGLRPDLANKEIYGLIKDNADAIDGENPGYQGRLGGGRLNVAKAVNAAKNFKGNAARLAVAPAGAHAPTVQLLDGSGVVRLEFLAYAENFRGGVNLAKADVNGDGSEEIITAAGPGGGPHIRVFDANGRIISQFFAYETSFSGGVNLAASDLDADGQAEIITAPQSGHFAEVKIFDYQGQLKKAGLAFSGRFAGGVNLAVSDINADGQMEIVTARSEGDSQVKVFNQDFKEILSFYAFPGQASDGVKLTAVNLYGDNRTELVAVAAGNYEPQVRIFSPAGNLENQWPAYDQSSAYGLNLTAGDFDADNEPEIFVSQAAGGSNDVKIFDFHGVLKKQFSGLDTGFSGGLNVMF